MNTTTEKARISYEEAPKGLFAAMLNVEKYVKQSGIAHSLLELIKVRASQINGCGYCLDMHHKDALKEGESFDRLYLLPAWEEARCYGDAEKAALHFTEVLTNIANQSSHDVEAAYERMAAYYSTQEIANIALAICQINSWNRIAISFGNIPGTYNPA